MSEEPSPPQKLDYRSTADDRRRVPKVKEWPADWRRRLLIAIIAAPIIFVLTLEAARRQQGRAAVRSFTIDTYDDTVNLQKQVDAYMKQTGKTPSSLLGVPEIQKGFSNYPLGFQDRWGHTYQLAQLNGKPSVISYGRDGKPGGTGMDSDITANTPARLPPMDEYLRMTGFGVILLASVAAGLTGWIAFAVSPDTRRRGGVWSMIAILAVTGGFAIIIGGIMAFVHTPTGH